MSDGFVETPLPSSPAGSAGSTVEAPFFRSRDWLAGLMTWAIAFVGYLLTLAPTVTLEDSGELLTAAYRMGVPHPPGYPIWVICAWVWSHLIPIGNIAWRINLMSAVASSAACGLLALLVSHSGRRMAVRAGFWQGQPMPAFLEWIISASAIGAGLILAFSPVLWSQAVITEVYGFDALCWMLVLVMLYRWSGEREKPWRLYLAALIWGIALTAHQTLVLLTVAFPVFVWFNDRKLGRDLLVPILVVIIGGVAYSMLTPGSLFREGSFSGFVLLAMAAGAGYWLKELWKQGPGLMGRWPQVVAIYGAVLLGLALYGYLYVASCTNPPLNWGHCSQWDGFRHHFLHGQSDKVHTERTVLQLWAQFNMFFDDLQTQFNIVYALLALLGLFFFRDLDDGDRYWMRFLFVAFLCLGLGYIFFSNPSYEKQKQFTDRVFFLSCHCLYAMWIGYGLILGCGYLFQEKPSLQGLAIPLAALIALLPAVSVWRNWSDQEEHGHDFGYRYGFRMFKPEGGYPAMDQHAILLGGTDPGRCVPSYLIFVESPAPMGSKSHVASCPGSETFDRRDVYILTQNALAEKLYVDYVRDQYGPDRPRLNDPATLANRSGLYRTIFGMGWKSLGRDEAYPEEPIWIPTGKDIENAIARYVEDLRNRAPQPGEEVRVENGQVSVSGITGIMAVNGLLTRDLFEHNKAKHTFYVEESYVIPWMYRYMEPYGTILKLNPEPLPGLTAEMVAQDSNYWSGVTDDLTHDPKFLRDDVAQRAYSKQRAAIAGLYAYRHLYPQAEGAYLQSIELCPDGPDGNFRLAQLYVDEHRYDDANQILTEYKKRDRYNWAIQQALDQVKQLRTEDETIASLEKQLADNPNDAQGWFNLALVLGQRGDCVDCIGALKRALTLDGPDQNFHKLAAVDQRLAACRNTPEFQRTLNGSAAPTNNNQPLLPFSIGK